MFERILLPLDGSPLSESILPTVVVLARACHSSVTLLHASPQARATSDTSSRSRNAPTQGAAADLSRIQGDLAGRDVEADIWKVVGDPADAILKVSEDGPYQLIAMSTHARQGTARGVLGSVADRVLQRTSIPLLLIHPGVEGTRSNGSGAFHTLIVPLDGSLLGETVLPLVESLARRFSATVGLVSVVPSEETMASMIDAEFYDPGLHRVLAAHAAKYLDGVRWGLHSRGLRVATHVLEGYAPDQIIEHTRLASDSLIVMSTHGQSGVGRWVLGSVADRVIRGAERPVLIVPPPQRRQVFQQQPGS
ncbi:MAG: universal stress protein [Chloroflexi bacterium]|nr:universal stress protein [Chloroflexota bacterium]